VLVFLLWGDGPARRGDKRIGALAIVPAASIPP